MNCTISDKKRKYQDLGEELKKKLCNLEEVTIAPIIISDMVIIPTNLHEYLETLQLNKNLYILMQKAVILNTTRMFLI